MSEVNLTQPYTQGRYRIASMAGLKLLAQTRVKSGNFGHQVNLDIHLQTVEIQLRRLLMSRLIRIFTVCLVNLFLFQKSKYETNKVAVRI